MRLYISSGTHIDEVEGRVAEITDQIGTPDVVFGEGGEASLLGQAITILYLLPRAPLIALAAVIQIFLILPVSGGIVSIVTGGTKGRDTDIMQQIAFEYGAEIYEVDPVHTARPVYDRPILWGLANWIPTITLPVALSQDIPFPTVTIRSIVWLSVIGYVLFYIMLCIVNAKRENGMAGTIRSRIEDVETACVVLGESHHAGVGERLVDSDGIDVLNPVPDDMEFFTRFNIYCWKFTDLVRN